MTLFLMKKIRKLVVWKYMKNKKNMIKPKCLKYVVMILGIHKYFKFTHFKKVNRQIHFPVVVYHPDLEEEYYQMTVLPDFFQFSMHQD